MTKRKAQINSTENENGDKTPGTLKIEKIKEYYEQFNATKN